MIGGLISVGRGWVEGRRCAVVQGDQWKTPYLWRAVDQNDVILDILVQSRRNAKVATRFFRKLLKGLRGAVALSV
jgi:transposase-like protein